MQLHRIFASAIIVALIGGNAVEAEEKRLQYGGYEWEVEAERAERVTHKGVAALALEKGLLRADGADFTDGVISFKVAYPEHRAFIGVAWRVQDRQHYEEIYLRAHLNDKPDGVQYTPVNHTLSAWQIYSDGNAIAPIQQDYDGWNDVKIVIKNDQADLYFNSEKPVLHIPDLKNNLPAGGLALRSTNRSDETTYFSDLVIRPLRPSEAIVGTPKPSKIIPDGLIDKWMVSAPFDESAVIGKTLLSGVDDQPWHTLVVETNGIANLSRLHSRQDGADTVFVRKTLTVDHDQIRELRFGFSDRVRLYLNGTLIYAGDDGFQTRDYRFLGLMGFHDTVGLNLKSGENELVAAVSETFGGWGWAAALSPEQAD